MDVGIVMFSVDVEVVLQWFFVQLVQVQMFKTKQNKCDHTSGITGD